MHDNYEKETKRIIRILSVTGEMGAGHIILLKTGNSYGVVFWLLHLSCLLWQSHIHSEKVVNSLRVLCSRSCYKGALLLFGKFTWNKLLQETMDEAVTNILVLTAWDWVFNTDEGVAYGMKADPKKSREIPEVSLSILKNLSGLGENSNTVTFTMGQEMLQM